jgi:uncharacterized membrane protein YbhN (UPF0104 family)
VRARSAIEPPAPAPRRIPWINWAGAVGLALFVPVLLQIEWQALRALAANTRLAGIGAALALLIGEGYCSTVRLHALLGGGATLASCLRITAWHVLWVMLMPARLGDVAGITLIRRHTSQRIGPATANVVIQRLFDLLALALTFAITVLLLGSEFALGRLAWAALALACAVPALVRVLPRLLTVAARFLRGAAARPRGRRRGVLRAVLHTRAWLRHQVTPRRAGGVLALSIAKWTLNLIGIATLVRALDLPLDPTEALVIAALYNLLAAVPLQSAGGIGITDLSLMAVFTLFGLPGAQAAGASVAIRACLITAPLGFWALALGTLALGRARQAPTSVAGDLDGSR